MILIALVLLIAVGPEQLPGLIRRGSRTLGQMRAMSEGLRRDLMSSMDELERASDPRKWAESDLDVDHSDQPQRFGAADPGSPRSSSEAQVAGSSENGSEPDLDPDVDAVDVDVDEEPEEPNLTTDSAYDSLVDDFADDSEEAERAVDSGLVEEGESEA